MKILVCDKCGKQHKISQIIGTEFENNGYQTLSPQYRSGGIKDLCAGCFKEMEKKMELYQKERKSLLERIFS